MSKSTSSTIAPKQRGLWGDSFSVHWLSNGIKIPIRLWSKKQMKSYLHFNSEIQTHTYDILFHDENSHNGHFEPLLRKREMNTDIGTIQNTSTKTYEERRFQCLQLDAKLIQKRLQRFPNFSSIYSESAFTTISHLTQHEYDVVCLHRIVSQTFCNAFKRGDPFAFQCIQKYVANDAFQTSFNISNWQ